MRNRRIAESLQTVGADKTLERVGANIRLARKRRELRVIDVARMACISPPTLRRVERGDPGTPAGAYVAVLTVLGFQYDVGRLANPERESDDLLPIELASRIRRISAPPDLLTNDRDPEDPGPRLQRETTKERRALVRDARKKREAWNAAADAELQRLRELAERRLRGP